MGFSVVPSDVSALGKQQERLQDDAVKGKSYVTNNTDLGLTGEGLINLVTGGHRNVQSEVENFLAKLADPTASNTAQALAAAARYYRSTDDDQAAAMDRTYPGVDVGAAKRGGREVTAEVGAFADITDPEEHYQPPKDYNGEFPYEPNWKDIISPGSLLRDAIWKVTEAATALGICDRPYDPFEVVLKPLCGDWAGLRACADVYRNVGAATTAMATNIRWSVQGLEESWTGNAADSATVHLLTLAKALESAKGPLESIAKEYESAANGANEFSASIGVLLADITDAAISAAASSAVAGLAGSTGVGLPVALVVGAFTLTRIYKVVKGIKDIIDLLVRLEAALKTFDAAGNDFGKVDQQNPLPKLPGGTPTVPR